jgi:ribosomal protein S18 acetylase RimI-like enzyme
VLGLTAACAAHAARLAALDPLLDAPVLETADLSVQHRDSAAFGRSSLIETSLDTEQALFSPLREHTLTVRLAGPSRGEAFAELLDQWNAQLSASAEPGDIDCAAAVRWPARDLVGSRAMAVRGFAPLTVLAVREAGRVLSGPTDIPVRRAVPGDLPVLVDFAVELLRADTPFGMLTERPAQREIFRAEISGLLADPNALVLVAYDGLELLGYVTAQSLSGSQWLRDHTSASALRYVPALYVIPQARSRGVGRTLAEQAHREIDASGAAVTLLHYALPSPTSAPFWLQQGYRPLWMLWQRRPVFRTTGR